MRRLAGRLYAIMLDVCVERTAFPSTCATWTCRRYLHIGGDMATIRDFVALSGITRRRIPSLPTYPLRHVVIDEMSSRARRVAHGDEVPLAYAAVLSLTPSGTGSGGFALCRNSTVVKSKSV